jgi:hypothetical protein
MGKKSRIKRDRRAGITFTPIKSPLDLPESIAFVLPAITDIEDLDNATAFPSFDDAVKAADEMGFNEVAQVTCLGPFVLGPTGKMWTRQDGAWIEVPPTLCEDHS